MAALVSSAQRRLGPVYLTPLIEQDTQLCGTLATAQPIRLRVALFRLGEQPQCLEIPALAQRLGSSPPVLWTDRLLTYHIPIVTRPLRT
jgi:hypothetical protein